MKKSDEQVLKQIEKGNKNLRKQQNAQLKGICQDYNISVERYQEMLKQYRGNIEFQQSMRPYFSSYFNTQK